MDSSSLPMRASCSSCSSYSSKLRIPIPSRLSFSFFGSIKCIHTSNFDSKSSLFVPIKPIDQNPTSYSYSRAVTSSSSISDVAVSKLQFLVSEFESISESIDRVKLLLHYATLLPQGDDSLRSESNRVMGCTARVWLDAKMDSEGRMRFIADSDSEITKGFCSCLILILDGAYPYEVMGLKTEDLVPLNVVGLQGKSNSRANTWYNVLIGMQKRTKAIVAEKEGLPRSDLFPSLVINTDGIQANGNFAEAQARFLFPDESKVGELVNVLREKKIGVVAHFYMDPEVQGVLTAAKQQWPHINISDSLVMADAAVNMAKAGCQYITVLGVDFMSENVRAILDQAGFTEVDVYRMSNEQISCSLADAASSPAYTKYLEAASSLSSPSLHVVYINTSLETKANSHELVPTITCTSSNVVPTILQAFAQVPNLNVWYGPDTYMGANIMELFQQMTIMTDEEIAEVHPEHNRSTIKSLLPHLNYFKEGTCIVHHLFGHEVVDKIRDVYPDAFLTAHFEVPGEMFALAMEAKSRGMGVVGSTQNILDFITLRLREALDRNVVEHLQFVLGTESGMVTSIVTAVRKLLVDSEESSGGKAKVSVEIVFPVSSESVSTTTERDSHGLILNEVIPGVASGEGCSIHGGCATCPYMKMNSLNSLLKVSHHLPENKYGISAYEAARFNSKTAQGKSVADVGCEPILHMRHFQATKKLPEKLVDQILHLSGNGKST
ncbi:quinolinate synthase, chloroplastic-like [Impatiens glandulifera]|uniref:quinolinate synthase, chloroplastic-like n=1 Tax=Impatiens glandulifera TaxID=253017 RepID=UPI001FB04BB9|nr:quinolinate synthase, chloroplastic-like [Impatiens glandulifera]